MTQLTDSSTPTLGSQPSVLHGPGLSTTPSMIPLVNLCAEVAHKVDVFLDKTVENEDPNKTELRKRTKTSVRDSLDVISEALRRYSFEELAISFNGGKDCLVMLILLLASIYYHSSEYRPQRIHTVYVHSINSFAEVDRFVNECASTYSLDLIRLPTPMKEAFQKFLDAKPHIKAIMVGTRRTDPNGHDLTFFDETDHGWPKFMRIHPIVDWHYAEIWHFLLELDVKYCPLYDMGYTSLGGTTDTFPNPALSTSSDDCNGDTIKYRPAYTLMDDDKERLGREKKI
ncbi:hypothetical protein V1511DRAFT_500402 [Dipodascopsis uninucleata]